ncbi:MAG: tRNA (adenosine(37)-N6)-dimethylallyltransferase MiaA [Bacillota bacterium]|nr:tRNA (adenosine(37)-N6)-dimethylallyltransferase MiaA [Bacillota bacterium]
MSKIPLIVIAGPTASGKTELSVKLALKYNGEVVSADSMQIYKDMNIGTAKPDSNERMGIAHHMIDICEIEDNFSVADYCEMAHKVIYDINMRGKKAILAGGTGLYIDSVIKDLSFKESNTDLNLRNDLNKKAKDEGTGAVYEILKEKDKEAAEKIHPNNLKRVIRAIEIVTLTGKSINEYEKESVPVSSRYDVKYIALRAQRAFLYEKINKRVDKMMKQGLYEEALMVYNRAKGKNLTCMQAIGYKEFIPVIEGKISLLEAVDELKKNTRRYAKRQLTWFSANENIRWIDIQTEDSFDKACRIIEE